MEGRSTHDAAMSCLQDQEGTTEVMIEQAEGSDHRAKGSKPALNSHVRPQVRHRSPLARANL